MDINISGGKNFSMNTLSSKLRYAARNSSLKDKHEAILKVVRGAQSAVRSGKFNSAVAMSKFKSANKDLSSKELRTVEGIMKKLSSVPAAEMNKDKAVPSSSLQKAIAAVEAKRSAKITDINKRILVNVTQGHIGYKDARTGSDHGTGLASGSAPAKPEV